MRKQLFLLVGLVVASSPALAVNFNWVQVGNPGNAPDTTTHCAGGALCGQVNYTYYISKYDTTNAQYAEFLNAVDPTGSNTLGLWNTNMQGRISGFPFNAPGSKYVVNSALANDPVVDVSFYDTLRFANWLYNGQGSASTETGAYTLLGGTPTPSNGTTVAANRGVTTFLPSENEWYKAAYYNPITNSYFAYPYGTSTPTTCAAPGATPNTANCAFAGGHVTPVGAYTGSASPYGAYDMGGNVWQWNEQSISGGSARLTRGGAWDNGPIDLFAPLLLGFGPSAEANDIGFRVATLVPDSDGDGILDPYDNCPYTPNGPLLGTCLGNFPQGQALCHANSDCTSGKCSLAQEDTGGVGTGSPPDGIGDACQCGDVSNDGIVNNIDAILIQRTVAGLAPYPEGVTTLPGYKKCQVVNGAPGLTCNNTQASLIQRAVVDLAPGIKQGCHAATISIFP